MKPNIVWTVFLFATLMLGPVKVASAQLRGMCSLAGVAGDWGYTETGWALQAGAWVPAASQGTYALDAKGNLSGTRVGSVGGETTLKGTATVNSDCTGTLTVNIYDQSGTTLLFTVVKALVYVDNAREVRGIVTSVVTAGGTSVSAVLTVNGKKLFHGLVR
jgi:hypothetical protein